MLPIGDVTQPLREIFGDSIRVSITVIQYTVMSKDLLWSWVLVSYFNLC